jgi:hypothetical protein
MKIRRRRTADRKVFPVLRRSVVPKGLPSALPVPIVEQSDPWGNCTREKEKAMVQHRRANEMILTIYSYDLQGFTDKLGNRLPCFPTGLRL